MAQVFLLLSTNFEPEQNLNTCLSLLREKCVIRQISSVYETAPVGEIYKNNFLDAVVHLETDLAPLAFREEVLGQIEQVLGRSRHQPPDGNIPIDLDILLWDNLSFDFGSKPWHVPDRKITREIHLALPLAELAPDYTHPEDGRTLREISQSLSTEGLVSRPDVKLE